MWFILFFYKYRKGRRSCLQMSGLFLSKNKVGRRYEILLNVSIFHLTRVALLFIKLMKNLPQMLKKLLQINIVNIANILCIFCTNSEVHKKTTCTPLLH